MAGQRPHIVVFSGPTATIQNSEPLVTSNKAREKYGLPPRTHPDGRPARFDPLRPQRLAAPVTVYVEQFSAHPLEADVEDLYAPADGYLDASGRFHTQRQNEHDIPVYEVTLRPEDGLYMLPYMARQANGQAWEADEAYPMAPPEQSRVPFYPSAARMFEEIDRFGVGEKGVSSILDEKADFDFVRAAPSGGYRKGLQAAKRTDLGQGDIPPERWGEHFFPYRPRHLRQEPPPAVLARLTNAVQRALRTGGYDGAIWLEGSPSVEETVYWLGLVIDTTVPICGNAAQRPHGAVGNDGDRNLIDSVDYILSRIWADEQGRDSIGAVVIQDEQVFTSRDIQKGDARPGGYVATGGHGGILATIGEPGPPVLTFRPVRRHTYLSEVNLTRIPSTVDGVRRDGSRILTAPVQVKDAHGDLVESAIPKVTMVKHARYLPDTVGPDPSSEVEILARVEKNLRDAPLSGLVAEGTTPYGSMSSPMETALRQAALSGLPVVKVSRGNAEGFVPVSRADLAIAGNNLTATKARLLLMACLLRFGSLPPASDPRSATEAELAATRAKLAEFQAVFDTH